MIQVAATVGDGSMAPPALRGSPSVAAILAWGLSIAILIPVCLILFCIFKTRHPQTLVSSEETLIRQGAEARKKRFARLDIVSPYQQYKQWKEYQEQADTNRAYCATTDDVCAFCLESFSDSQQIREALCRHVYHAKCIDSWFQKDHDVCPLCRAPLLKCEEDTPAVPEIRGDGGTMV